MRNKDTKLLGMSLVEMSVALVLGTGLVLIMLQTYQSTVVDSTRQWQQLHQRLDGLRLATVLQQEINVAGFIGCPRWSPALPVQYLQTRWRVSATDALKVYQASAQHWRPALPTELQGKVAPGTDVIQIVHGQGELHHVLSTTQAAKIWLTMPAALTPEDTVVIANCERAVIAEVASVHADHIQLTQALPEPFSPPATVVLLQRYYFFVNRRQALAWQAFDHAAQALMEEVVQWRVQPITVANGSTYSAESIVGVDVTLWQTGVAKPWRMQLAWFNHE